LLIATLARCITVLLKVDVSGGFGRVAGRSVTRISFLFREGRWQKYS